MQAPSAAHWHVSMHFSHSIEALADEAGISRSQLWRLLEGECSPSVETVAALDCKPSALLPYSLRGRRLTGGRGGCWVPEGLSFLKPFMKSTRPRVHLCS